MEPPPTRRPLLAAAGALHLGAQAAASPPPVALGLALGALFLGACAARRSGAALAAALFVTAALTAGVRGLPGDERAAPEGGWRAGTVVAAAVRGDAQRLTWRDAAGRAAELRVDGATFRRGEEVALSVSRVLRPARGPVEPARPRNDTWLPLPDELVRLAPGPARIDPLAALRAAGARRLGRLPAPAGELAPALLFGERRFLTAETSDLFTRTGTRHLLALSGLHVGLFALLLLFPLSRVLGRGGQRLAERLGLGPRARAWLGCRELYLVAALAVCVPLWGANPPVRRAAAACALGLLARFAGDRHEGGRGVDALSIWSLALLLEGAAEPGSAGAVSVQLSYAATLGILLGTRGLEHTLRGLLSERSVLPPLRPLLPTRRGIVLRWFGVLTCRAVAASCAATVATLPVAWNTFGEVSLPGILATPLAVIALVPLLVLGLLLAVAGDVPLAARVLEPLAEWSATGLLALLRLFDPLPGTPLVLPARPAVLVWTACALALAAWTTSRRRATYARLSALLFAVLCVPWRPPPDALEVTALDVGRGTAVCLRGARLGTWLFDAGAHDRPGLARGALLPLLAEWDPGALRTVLSHGHRDHGSALPWVHERWPVALHGGAETAQRGVRFAHAAPRVEAGRGRTILRKEPPRVELLRGLEEDGNEGSRCLVVDGGPGARLLLCGDAEGPGLLALLERGRLDGPFDLLLFPHHGSDSPWAGRLLEAARPAEVWVSSPPAPAVARELDRRGIPWRCTGEEGPLRAVLPLRPP